MKKAVFLLFVLVAGVTSAQDLSLNIPDLVETDQLAEIPYINATLSETTNNVYTIQRKKDDFSSSIKNAINGNRVFPNVYLKLKLPNGDRSIVILKGVSISNFEQGSRRSETFEIVFQSSKPTY